MASSSYTHQGITFPLGAPPAWAIDHARQGLSSGIDYLAEWGRRNFGTAGGDLHFGDDEAQGVGLDDSRDHDNAPDGEPLPRPDGEPQPFLFLTLVKATLCWSEKETNLPWADYCSNVQHSVI